MRLKEFDISTVAPRHTEPVTKSDSARFAPSLIYVGDAGTVTTISANGATCPHGEKAAGDVLFGVHIAVLATGTDATIFLRGGDE